MLPEQYAQNKNTKMESEQKPKKSKKKLIIIVLTILGLLAFAGNYAYKRYTETKDDRTIQVTIKSPIQLYTYDINVRENNGYTKYKLLPANTTVSIQLDKWHNLEGVGYFYKIKNFDGRDDVFAEEKIHKYIPPSELSYYSFDNLNYYEVFPSDDYNEIPSKFQSCIVDLFYKNQFHSNKIWRFTSIPDRVKDVVAFGDFIGNNTQDVAIVLEDYSAQNSQIYILHKNASNDCDIVYSGNWGIAPTIKSFKKGQFIYINEYYGNFDKTPAPNDGIFIKNSSEYKAIFYSPKEKRFVQYDQYTAEEVKNMEQNAKNNSYNEESDEDQPNEETISEVREAINAVKNENN